MCGWMCKRQETMSVQTLTCTKRRTVGMAVKERDATVSERGRVRKEEQSDWAI